MSDAISRFRRGKKGNVDTDLSSEKLMLSAAILSTNFCRTVFRKYKPEFIQNEFIRDSMNWCMDYFREFDKAPKSDIERVFEYKSSKLDPSSKELIEYLLFSISQDSKGLVVSDHNYVLKETLKYFRKRHLDIALMKSRALLDSGNVDKAVESIAGENFQEDLAYEGRLEDIFDRESIESAWSKVDTEHVFAFSGGAATLNKLVGYIKKGWLMAFLAPPKRGKTSWLLETACQAMSYGAKVLFVSLEMNSKAIRQRFYSRFLNKPYGSFQSERNFKTGPGGELLSRIPYIDCEHNKSNSCKREERTKYKTEHYPSDDVEDTEAPCFGCIYSPESDFSFSVESIWVEVNSNSYEADHRSLFAIGRHLKRYLRLVTYPSFLGGIDDIQQDLEVAKSQGFRPDVIIIDYADILKPPGFGGGDPRHNLDLIWKTLKGLAEATNSVVITASQTNRKAVEERRIGQKHVAEDFRKLAHVDVFMAINQNDFEKDIGIKRINVIAHRHKDFSENVELNLTEALHMGQVCVSSIIPPRKKKKEEDEDE